MLINSLRSVLTLCNFHGSAQGMKFHVLPAESCQMLLRRAVYNTIGGLDWWTGLVDWTTGLIDFHLKCTEMLRNVAQSTTVAISLLGPG